MELRAIDASSLLQTQRHRQHLSTAMTEYQQRSTAVT